MESSLARPTFGNAGTFSPLRLLQVTHTISPFLFSTGSAALGLRKYIVQVLSSLSVYLMLPHIIEVYQQIEKSKYFTDERRIYCFDIQTKNNRRQTTYGSLKMN